MGCNVKLLFHHVCEDAGHSSSVNKKENGGSDLPFDDIIGITPLEGLHTPFITL